MKKNNRQSSSSAPTNLHTNRCVRIWRNHTVHLTVVILGLFVVSMMIFAGMDLLARNLMTGTPPVDIFRPVPTADDSEKNSLPSSFSLREFAMHPDRLFEPYFSTRPYPEDVTAESSQRIRAFRKLLNRYRTRQETDDNFTIRVIDNRTDATLEIYSLSEARRIYDATHKTDWKRIDKIRAEQTRSLTDKYQSLGIPREAITIKWGRANQVIEARERDAPFEEYEVRLSAQFGLSLLATEIGTVETFNDDRLVSRVGARSRYQIMPYLLRKTGIHHYRLHTVDGKSVRVFEEWHPLLTMETAFSLIRGYSNAVGHEIPGLSAYHAGPFNIFKIYRTYLTQAPRQTVQPRVFDAFIWGITDGYDTVSKNSSFRAASRGYVPAAYGTLRADDNQAVDTTRTLIADRVRLLSGKKIALRELLDALQKVSPNLRPSDRRISPYNRFRSLNPHFELPWAPDSAGVPNAGNVLLASSAGTSPVRFFLPRGAARRLAGSGIAWLDEKEIRHFDHNTYTVPPDHFQTRWDKAYDELVRRIGHFGFTESNRILLDSLVVQFDRLALADPSAFRLRQQTIIHTHASLWHSRAWTDLAVATAANAGRLRARIQPPDPIHSN